MAISMFQKVMKKFFGGLPVGNQHAEYQKKFTTQFTTFSSLRVVFYHSGATLRQKENR